MKKTGIALITVALVLLTGCKDNFVNEQTEINGRILTITASMPGDEPSTRIGLSEISGSLNLSAKWEAGDKVKLFFVQSSIRVQGEEATISNITSDNKKCSFSISIPQEIDISKPFNIYGFSDIQGIGVDIRQGIILADVMPVECLDMDNIPVPVWFKAMVNDVKQPVSANFVHLGAYEVIHVKNDSQQTLQLPKCRVVPGGFFALWYFTKSDGGTENDYYPFFEPEFIYDEYTGVITNNQITGHTSPSVPTYSIAAGEVKTVITWYVPFHGVNVPDISVKIGDKMSENKLPTKYKPMIAGRAYHIYVAWNGVRHMITGDDFDTTGSYMTLTTTKAVGQNLSFVIDANDADWANVWIDLNNNGIKEAGETPKRFDGYSYWPVPYKIGSQTITIHGDVTMLYCGFYDNLTLLDVSRNPRLQRLRVTDNKGLPSLDVSKNLALWDLDCGNNGFTSLDVSHNTNLQKLNCVGNNLTSLDLSNNGFLSELLCQGNQLTSLDLSKFQILTTLYCSGNKLSELDVSKNLLLKTLACGGNTIKTLDVSKNTELSALYVDDSEITSLDLSNNKKLANFSCMYNKTLTSLDFSQNTKLWQLTCTGSSGLTQVNVSNCKELRYVTFENTQALTKLDLSGLPNLLTVRCIYSSIADLNCSGTTSLEELDCDEMESLANLNLSGSSIKKLKVSKSALTALDVSGCPKLERIDCHNNPKLITLNVSNTSLLYLGARWNAIETITAKNTSLHSLDIVSNKLGVDALNTLFTDLPDVRNVPINFNIGNPKTIMFYGNPGYKDCDKKIVTDKGWKVD